MTNKNMLKGIVPVLLTPLTKDGAIDETGFANLIEYLLGKSIGGLWVLGTGGEDMNLTYKKRLQVARVVTQITAGRTPIILGAGFFALEESLNFMEDTKHLDFTAYHVMPYHPLLSLDRIEWQYITLADAATKPLWMYSSANWTRHIPPEFVERMKGYPNIAGIKYSTSNAVHTEKVLSLADEGFQVITAVVRQLFASLSLGAKGCTTAEACPFPDPIIDIYDLFMSGKREQALAAQRRFNRFLESLPTGPGKDNFLKSAEGKFILSLKGICEPYVSGYYRGLTDGEKADLKAALKRFEEERG